MRLYETTFLINPQTDDATIDRHVRDVADLIASGGGKVVYENRLGTRRLAYDIKGLSQAFYATLIFESETTVLPALERHFRLEEAYLRDLTIVFEGNLERLLEDTSEVTERPAAPPKPEPKKEEETSSGAPIGRRETEAEPTTTEGEANKAKAEEATDDETPAESAPADEPKAAIWSARKP